LILHLATLLEMCNKIHWKKNTTTTTLDFNGQKFNCLLLDHYCSEY